MNQNQKFVAIAGIAIASIIIASLSFVLHFNSQNSENHANDVGVKREFWLFSSEIPEFNETKMGMPRDVFSMQSMIVTKGDTVVIHFFNTEQGGGDLHSFTISEKPYNVNVILKPGENKTVTFDATTAGVFVYECTFHQPTMRGQLIVEMPPQNFD